MFKQKKVMRPLSDAEYEEIFAAVLERYPPVEEDIDSEPELPTPKHTKEDPSNMEVTDTDHKVFDFRVAVNPDSTNIAADPMDSNDDFDDMELDKMPDYVKSSFDDVGEPVKVNPSKSPKSPPSSVMKNTLISKNDIMKSKFGVKTKGKSCVKQVKELPKQCKAPEKEKSLTVNKKEMMLDRKIEQTGTWVQCTKSSCTKWRYLASLHDPATLPEVWTCAMNTDAKHNSCEIGEEEYDNDVHDEEYIFTRYTEGSLVWAKMTGYPWWPGMVEIDPDIQNYFECRGFDNVASHYHVVYFDEKVSRAWVNSPNMIPFTGSEHNKELLQTKTKHGDFKKNIAEARLRALSAKDMTISERLKKYSFANRYKGKWSKPNKSHDSAKKNKKRSRSKTLKDSCRATSPPRSDASLPVDYLEALPDLLTSQDDSDLFNSAENLLKDADDVLSEFFSSQQDEEYEESSKKKFKKHKSKKLLQKEVPVKTTPELSEKLSEFDPDIYTMENETQVAEICQKKKKKKKKPRKQKDGSTSNETSNNVAKKQINKSINPMKIKPQFAPIKVKPHSDINNNEDTYVEGMSEKSVSPKGENIKDSKISSSFNSKSNNSKSKSGNLQTKPRDFQSKVNCPPTTVSSPPSKVCSSHSKAMCSPFKEIISQSSGKDSSPQNSKKKVKKFAAPIMSKKEMLPTPMKSNTSIKTKPQTPRKQSTPRKVSQVSQSSHHDDLDLNLDINIISSQKSIMSLEMTLESRSVNESVKVITPMSQDLDSDSDPMEE